MREVRRGGRCGNFVVAVLIRALRLPRPLKTFVKGGAMTDLRNTEAGQDHLGLDPPVKYIKPQVVLTCGTNLHIAIFVCYNL